MDDRPDNRVWREHDAPTWTPRPALYLPDDLPPWPERARSLTDCLITYAMGVVWFSIVLALALGVAFLFGA